MSIQLLKNSCGVAEYRGTYYNTAKDLLKNYAKERSETKRGCYGKAEHTFVVMTLAAGYVTAAKLKAYCTRHKLGAIVASKPYNNINHTGNWYANNKSSLSGRELTVVIYTPNHKNLTEWLQKFDKNYSL